MASVRNIKKDIDFLVGEVVSDCYTYLYLNGDKNRDKVVEIIEGVVGKRNDFIHRVNNPAKDADRKQTRKHYKQIYSDLLGSVDESFSQLSQLVG